MSYRRATKNEVRKLLGVVYRREGAAIWMEQEHADWNLTVDEMFAQGRGDEVLAKVNQLVSGSFA